MKITLIAAGHIKDGLETRRISEYARRLPWPVEIIEIEEKRPLPAPDKMKSEGEKLLQKIPKGGFIIALDKAGKTFSSREFSSALQKWAGAGASHLAFIIGGADGLSEEVLKAANVKLSFGPMTWPHQLARVMVMEQLYRAWAIGAGHPYHK